MKKTVLFFIMSIFLFNSSSYANYACKGKVTTIALNASGILTISVGNINWVYLCSLSTPHNAVAPEACKGMLALLTAAKLTGNDISLYFTDTSNDCTNSAHPAWSDLKN